MASLGVAARGLPALPRPKFNQFFSTVGAILPFRWVVLNSGGCRVVQGGRLEVVPGLGTVLKLKQANTHRFRQRSYFAMSRSLLTGNGKKRSKYFSIYYAIFNNYHLDQEKFQENKATI